jgi:hypothetical protein
MNYCVSVGSCLTIIFTFVCGIMQFKFLTGTFCVLNSAITLRGTIMSVRRISSRLQKILHSLATRVPKVVLHRAEDIFPALITSLVSNQWLCF